MNVMIKNSHLFIFIFLFFIQRNDLSSIKSCAALMTPLGRKVYSKYYHHVPVEGYSIKSNMVTFKSFLTTKITNREIIGNNPTVMEMAQSKFDNDDKNIMKKPYNDDAFGLVFLIGGFGSNDEVFSIIFLLLSSVAAIATSNGVLKQDSRIPSLIAVVSLLLAPIVISLRSTGSLDNIEVPALLEVCTCFISVIAGFYKWNNVEKKNLE